MKPNKNEKNKGIVAGNLNRSEDIGEMLVAIEDKLLDLESQVQTRQELARECHRILQKILRKETGIYNISEASNSLFASYAAEPHIKKLIENLIRQLLLNIHIPSKNNFDFLFNPLKVVNDCREFLNWFIQRRRSVNFLDQLDDSVINKSFFFNPAVNYDVARFGTLGFSIVSGLHLIGLGQEPIWCKVRLYNDGKPVMPRHEWQLWTDDAPPSRLKDAVEIRRFSSILPFVCDRQRVICDEVDIFVPYEALALNDGFNQLEAEIIAVNHEGSIIDEARVPVAISVKEDQFLLAPVPSPQSLSIWNKDPINGNSINRIIVDMESNKYDAGYLIVLLDLDLTGHEGEEVVVDLRLISSSGALIKSKSDEYQGKDGGVVVTKKVFLSQQITRIYGMEMSIPLSALDLDPGLYPAFCEVVVSLCNGRCLCGGIERVELDIRPFTGITSSPENLGSVWDPVIGISLNELSVTPNFINGDRRNIRFDATFSSQHNYVAPFRVQFSLEDRAGKPLLNRFNGGTPIQATYLIGDEYPHPIESKVIVSFDHSELPTNLPVNNASEASIFMRIHAFALEGTKLFTFRKEILINREQLSLAFDPPSEQHDHVIISDVVWNSITSLPDKVVLNILPTSPIGQKVLLVVDKVGVFEPHRDTTDAIYSQEILVGDSTLPLQDIRQKVIEIPYQSLDLKDGLVRVQILTLDGALIQRVISQIDYSELSDNDLISHATLEQQESQEIQQTQEDITPQDAPTEPEIIYAEPSNLDPSPISISTLNAHIGSSFITITYTISGISTSNDNLGFQIDLLDEKGVLVRDRFYNSAKSSKYYDGIHEHSRKGIMSFDRDIIINDDSTISLEGRIKIEPQRLYLKSGTRTLTIEAIIFDTYGEELAQKDIEILVDVPVSKARGLGKMFEWLVEN